MTSTPLGKLIAIGGAEDKGTDLETGIINRNNLNFFELGIIKRIVAEIPKSNPRIEVITTASSIPVEVGDNYIQAFHRSGCDNTGILDIRNRADVAREDYLERILKADAVMFSGGNQYRLTSIFGGTRMLELLHERYEQEPDFVLAGTSAGAMAMSNTMIFEGNASKAHLKGEVKITTGLAFNSEVVFDSHFDKRGRFARLAQAIAANPSCIGVGLGEDTGIVVRNGQLLEAIGSGMVIIIDGHNMQHTNIADIPVGNPISIENLIVHFMTLGDRYDVKERRFVGAEIQVPAAE